MGQRVVEQCFGYWYCACHAESLPHGVLRESSGVLVPHQCDTVAWWSDGMVVWYCISTTPGVVMWCGDVCAVVQRNLVRHLRGPWVTLRRALQPLSGK